MSKVTTYERLPESLGGFEVEVFWELGDQYDDAGDGHCFFYHADGYSPSGYRFSGSASVVDEEWDSVEDVEFEGEE
jgi:hypothetical protein